MSINSSGEPSEGNDLVQLEEYQQETGQTRVQMAKSERDKKMSWTAILERSLVRTASRNVLEVILEKDWRGSFSVSDSDCAQFLMKLGLDMRSGQQIEGVQICPSGRGVIYITLKDNVDISNFYRYDVVDVTSTGIRSVIVKSAGKREVVVTIKGIHPSTLDDIVFDYLENFGRIVTRRVVYGIFSDGPLNGIKNGDRSYKLELAPWSNIGSYHVLEGQKVTLKYAGQQQTCGRCLQASRNCPGRGVTKRCESEGGSKRDFVNYILELWNEIGYSPQEQFIASEDDNDREITRQIGGKFTPVKHVSSPDKFAGICVKSFSTDTDHGSIIEFLIKEGLPPEKTDSVQFGKNGTVTIRNLDSSLSLQLINKIHGSKPFSRVLYCNGIIPMSPEKTIQDKQDTQDGLQSTSQPPSSDGYSGCQVNQ